MKIVVAMLISKNDLALIQFSDLVGEFIDYWGFKKIHGQTWALIHLSSEPMSATHLCKKLGVSKALMSLSIKDLLKFNVIRKSARHGKRTTFFESNPNLYEVITEILKNRECVLIEKIFSHHQKLGKLLDADKKCCHPANFKELGTMIGTAQFFLKLIVEKNLEIEKLIYSFGS